MPYDKLSDFIENRMRMSHVYQPVMLKTLLENNGQCHGSKIAKALLVHDASQIEYYTRITNNMVGRVLRDHKYVELNKKTKLYSLVDYKTFTQEQISELIELCKKRLDTFLEVRGEKIFDHRRKSSGYIRGTIKYDVLKRARFRCELCGISADVKALEVDHIVPRNKGGTDDQSNLQSLCYSCNAMKRDRDDTDFRSIRDSYEYREKDCIFCEIDQDQVINENELSYVIHDCFPVTERHTLIIPKRHVGTYFELSQAEINACNQLIKQAKDGIENDDSNVDGFNIGINNGKSAGQTIFHCHIHLIPRRSGDIDNPRGGVRHTIPEKGYY
jgi:ATP adenylyltransferase